MGVEILELGRSLLERCSKDHVRPMGDEVIGWSEHHGRDLEGLGGGGGNHQFRYLCPGTWETVGGVKASAHTMTERRSSAHPVPDPTQTSL